MPRRLFWRLSLVSCLSSRAHSPASRWQGLAPAYTPVRWKRRRRLPASAATCARTGPPSRGMKTVFCALIRCGRRPCARGCAVMPSAVLGLSWRSANAKVGNFKSAQLRDFCSLLRLPNCRFIDLQYGDTLAERQAIASARRRDRAAGGYRQHARYRRAGGADDGVRSDRFGQQHRCSSRRRLGAAGSGPGAFFQGAVLVLVLPPQR